MPHGRPPRGPWHARERSRSPPLRIAQSPISEALQGPSGSELRAQLRRAADEARASLGMSDEDVAVLALSRYRARHMQDVAHQAGLRIGKGLGAGKGKSKGKGKV